MVDDDVVVVVVVVAVAETAEMEMGFGDCCTPMRGFLVGWGFGVVAKVWGDVFSCFLGAWVYTYF